MADEDRRSEKERKIETDAPVVDDTTPAVGDDGPVGTTRAVETPAMDAGLDDAAVAKGPAEEIVDAPKDDKDAPVFQPPETEAIMEIGNKDEAAEKDAKSEIRQPTSAPVDMDAEDVKTAGPEQGMSDNEMVSIFNTKHMPVIHDVWGVPQVDPELMEALGQSGSVRKSKFGLEFNLPNGHRLEWHQDLGGAEFIGMAKRSSNFDMDDAHATIAASKSRGWSAINVHGTVEEREMLWLEAQRQGMEVTNFVPSADSDVRRQWEIEQQEKLEKVLGPGITPSSHPDPDPNLVAKQIKELENDSSGDPTPPADTPEADAQEVSTPSSFMGPKPDDAASKADVDTASKGPAPELPAGSMTFQQFLEREMADGSNSPEMVRGYMEMQAAMVEGKIDPSDIDAIQLGRSQGMGGNTMRQKMDSTLTASEYNDLAAGFETVMREKGGQPGFKLDRLDVSDEPSSPAMDTSALKEASSAPRQRSDAPKV